MTTVASTAAGDSSPAYGCRCARTTNDSSPSRSASSTVDTATVCVVSPAANITSPDDTAT